MYFPRTLELLVSEVSAHFPAVMLTGARQTGKTTLLKKLAGKDRGYVTLDNPHSLLLAHRDPAGFIQNFPGPILIDEIQYAPQLFPYIKMAADSGHTPGRFWLTGSQKFSMMKNVSESLAGRVGILSLMGLSLRELFGRGHDSPRFLPDPALFKKPYANPLTSGELFRLIWRGSFPALAADKDLNRDVFFNSYVETYVKRDVRDLTQVGNEATFVSFLTACAARTGQLLNMADISRAADISPTTGKQWLSVLEASGLVFLLRPYFTNVTKRMVKAPKLYFLDTGLAAFLTRWPTPETLEMSSVSGAFFETWVIGELLKNWLGHGPVAPFYYYRDKDQTEIDLLIIQGDTVHPLEIKKSGAPDIRDIRHFQAIKKLRLKIGPGGVVCLAAQAQPLAENQWIIPAGLI
jgi:predicted AAA+ superfamily ATPase